MPRPLHEITGGKSVSFTGGLPADVNLSAAAMSVISAFSGLESDGLRVLVTLFPGKAERIASFYAEQRGEAGKSAILGVLAEAVMRDDEARIFQTLTKKRNVFAPDRNCLAHSYLGFLPDFPGMLVAVDPRIYLTNHGLRLDEQADLVAKAKAGQFIQGHPPADDDRLDKYLWSAAVYTRDEMVELARQIHITSGRFLRLSHYLGWRIAGGFVAEKYPQKIKELMEELQLA